MKILLVEGDTDTRKGIEDILIGAGFETVTAASVSEAKAELAKNSGFGLVISDLLMPEEDGPEFLKFLCGNSIYTNIPVLVCTAMGDKEAVLQSISLGADEFIVKPVQAESLVGKIGRLAEKRRRSILVVDDEKTVRKVLQITLKRFGYNVLTAGSAGEALSIMENGAVGLVISDIIMPEMNGLELLGELKKKYRQVPVFMITGMNNHYREKDIKEAGADGLIAKPFNNMDIIEAVRSKLTV